MEEMEDAGRCCCVALVTVRLRARFFSSRAARVRLVDRLLAPPAATTPAAALASVANCDVGCGVRLNTRGRFGGRGERALRLLFCAVLFVCDDDGVLEREWCACRRLDPPTLALLAACRRPCAFASASLDELVLDARL